MSDMLGWRRTQVSAPSVLTALVLLKEREFEELSVLDTEVPDLPLTLGLWARHSV